MTTDYLAHIAVCKNNGDGNFRTVSIESSAFGDCYCLTSINLYDSITTIEQWAFSGCENLNDVYYSGTVEQWKAIEIGDNEVLTQATIHCCDGDLKNGECLHVLSDWATVKEASYTEEGLEQRECNWCEYVETRATEKLPWETDPEGNIHGICGEQLAWTLAEGTLTISGKGEMYEIWWPYEFPDEPPVFAPWHDFAEEITTVIVEYGATSIGKFKKNFTEGKIFQ